MNVARLSYFVSASALALAAVPATAQTVIDFGGLDTTGPFGGNGKAFTSYTEDGFTVSAPAGQYVQSTQDGSGDQLSLLTGAFNTTQAALLTITGPSLFRFTSFDAKLGSGPAASFTITGYEGSTQAFTYGGAVPSTNIYATYANAFTANIDRLTIGTNSDLQFFVDNLTFGPAVTSGAVPEPATWAMMIAGFGLVGGAMRRRSIKVAFA